MLKIPSPTPPNRAYWMPDGRPAGSDDRDIRITATNAAAIPTITPVGGRPSRTNPTDTGRVAATRPVTGATTPIRPTARPW